MSVRVARSPWSKCERYLGVPPVRWQPDVRGRQVQASLYGGEDLGCAPLREVATVDAPGLL
jgi:hypothetical protein